jgi:hypothetical protein
MKGAEEMTLAPLAGDNQNSDEEYTVDVVDIPQHTPGHMCWDPTCPCHDDPEIIGGINQHVQDGLLTPDNATDIVKGKNIWNL